MKLRKVHKNNAVQVEARSRSAWVPLSEVTTLNDLAYGNGVNSDLSMDLLSVLQLGQSGWRDLQAEVNSCDYHVCSNGTLTVPVDPRSFRDFMLFEDHVINASRGYARRFMPRAYGITKIFEMLTRQPFPKFKPHSLWYKQPIYYFGNHLNFQVSGQTIPWPTYSNALDYELELGAVLSRPLFNASPEEAEEAIGGFVVLNDISARDVQVDEMNSGFGPQKAKHFTNAMSEVIVTADEILPNLSTLQGGVSINGKRVADCQMKDAKYTFGEIIAFTSTDEQLHPGELFGSGTLPGGSGMENGHWLKPGDELSLEIEGVGMVSNIISAKGDYSCQS